jgi:hypothetical protein
MRVLASISLTLFYCLFATSGQTNNSTPFESNFKFEKEGIATTFSNLPVFHLKQNPKTLQVQKATAFPRVNFSDLSSFGLSFKTESKKGKTSFLSPRELRILSALSPPV